MTGHGRSPRRARRHTRRARRHTRRAAVVLTRPSLFHGWVIVAVTAVVMLSTAGIRSAPGALLVPMMAEVHRSNSSLAAAA